MYSVELSQRAQKFLEKLDNHLARRIEERLIKLKENPVPLDAKFIGRDGQDKIFRYRIGNYRALYLLIDSKKIVLITKIDKRPRIYDGQ